MTDKITDRLRVTEADGRPLPLHDLRYEAAAEIKRLRALYASSVDERVVMIGEIERLRARLAGAERERDKMRKVVWSRIYGAADDEIELYPCVLCGYNGQGFYQPDQHPCAAMERQP